MTKDEAQAWADERLYKVVWLLVVDPNSVLGAATPPPMLYRTFDRAMTFIEEIMREHGGEVSGAKDEHGWPNVVARFGNGQAACILTPVFVQFELPPI